MADQPLLDVWQVPVSGEVREGGHCAAWPVPPLGSVPRLTCARTCSAAQRAWFNAMSPGRPSFASQPWAARTARAVGGRSAPSARARRADRDGVG